jgi:Uma2 family endonuclease
VVLTPRPDAYAASHPEAGDALLVVEVSDSSLDHDRKMKLPVYARCGVLEVWIVDLSGRAVEVYRDPMEGRYASRMTRGALTPVRVPAVTIDVFTLLA